MTIFRCSRSRKLYPALFACLAGLVILATVRPARAEIIEFLDKTKMNAKIVHYYDGVYSVDAELLDHIAVQTIRASMRIGAAAGAGLGMGGMFTMLPDLGILAAITLRMLQKLSLIYGFPYNTEEEEAELWVAAASAAGVDISRELVEKQFVSKFVPRVIQRIAVRASGEIVEKWTARLIPVVSSVIGAGLNYYFVKVWGERAIGHFRQKHLQVRLQQANNRITNAAMPAR